MAKGELSSAPFDVTVGDRYRVTIPVEALAGLDWSGEVSHGELVTLKLMGLGQVRILPKGYAANARTLAAADDDPVEATRRLGFVLFDGNWMQKRDGTVMMSMPRTVASYAFEAEKTKGPLYLWAEAGWLELWSVRRRVRLVAEMTELSAEHL